MEQQQVESFVRDWPASSTAGKEGFIALWQQVQGLSDATLEFHARPGVSYSLRGICRDRASRPLFVMVDVIDDDPRWLSVCFYGEDVTDPEQRGDLVPGGLLGEDGLCFDIDEADPSVLDYVRRRIDEAYAAASIA
ncbi:hypothetical protein [Desulfofustis glycolicus]|uniref:DUF5655 domain-containing protein n=1 Tax=Desulfofustis glycolicus DSM 9705 TaxID=1121409 RepID=A0A1M5S9G7_9BACT|nr:hypothetical protein [Desulfofustis glycolicus]MCB2216205.1 hypothetical protein [Desulfobulbaceae bacterium]SHH34918.1 hypothetical protein SAMN02745124_00223 [Desulfofustis glycolicus DSM 9705]